MMQSVVPAVYPILKASYHLDFSQIGLITASLQITASLLQPLVGIYTDAHRKPYSLAIGMGFTLTGLLLLSYAPSFRLRFSSPSRWSASDRPSFIPNPRASRA